MSICRCFFRRKAEEVNETDWAKLPWQILHSTAPVHTSAGNLYTLGDPTFRVHHSGAVLKSNSGNAFLCWRTNPWGVHYALVAFLGDRSSMDQIHEGREKHLLLLSNMQDSFSGTYYPRRTGRNWKPNESTTIFWCRLGRIGIPHKYDNIKQSELIRRVGSPTTDKRTIYIMLLLKIKCKFQIWQL